ncbi:MAG: ABC transporter substrate-binding protein, partial [Anaerolineae bacterium]
MLKGLVASGELPPVDERVSDEPMVITPWEQIGQYGGTWHRLAVGPDDIQMIPRINYNQMIRWSSGGGETVPNVVTGWEINGDNTEFTFHLRRGMKWSDGAPYTSDDVAFYFEDWMTNEDLTPTVNSNLVRGGEPVAFTKLDDANFRLTFAAPYPLLIPYLAGANLYWFHQLPRHYLEQFHPNYTDQGTLDKAAKEAGFEFWYQ